MLNHENMIRTSQGHWRNSSTLFTKNEIIQFAKQYDPVPLHIDEEAAACSILGG